MKKAISFLILMLLLCFNAYANDANKVELTQINPTTWVHITYGDYNGSPTPSNGLIVVTDAGLVLVDTPWTNAQTKELIKLTKAKFKKNIVLAIITHAHQDRIGGIDTLLANKIKTISTNLTAQFAQKAGYTKPQATLDSDIKSFSIGKTKFETYYPGAGHTKDNIVVYLPDSKILFGGCLVKALTFSNIGNVVDGDLTEYPISVKKVLNRYSDAKIVIPGHGNWGDIGLLKHTLELAESSQPIK